MLLNTLLGLSLIAGCTRSSDRIEPDSGGPAVINANVTTEPDGPKPGVLTEVVNLPEDQQGLVQALEDGETAEAALDKLVAMGPSVVPALRDVALHGSDIGARGWAIQGLTRIDDPSADTALLGIQEYGAAPELVRTWAAAGRINRAKTLDEVLALAVLAGTYPALERPIRLKVESFSAELTDPESAIEAMLVSPELVGPLTPTVLGSGPGPVAQVMFTHENNEVRRMAAGFLGTIGTQDTKSHMEIAGLYAYTPGAEQVLWEGGALYVPSLEWKKKEAQVLAGHLVSWHLYCDLNGLVDQKNQIYNNLQSINLHRAAGWPDWPSTDTNGLLIQYGQATSKASLQKVLAEHGVADQPKYKKLLDQVK